VKSSEKLYLAPRIFLPGDKWRFWKGNRVLESQIQYQVTAATRYSELFSNQLKNWRKMK